MISFAQVMEQTNRNLDKHQIEAIYCDNNCVVSAGAGSGKTTVLSYRFLRLVLEQKADCDQILTLTFTRKAAREMRERIHKQLLAYKDDPLVSMQLAKFPDSSIATLDSFCSTIVRCDCTSYGIASDFGIDDELNRKNAVRCARSLLEKACFGEGGKILARLYTPDDLIDTLLVPLATRHYYLPQTLTSDATEQVLAVVQAELDRLLASFTELLETYAHFTERTKSVQEVQVLASSLLQKMEMSSDSSSLFALLGDKACLYRKPGKGSGEDFTLLKETTEDYRMLRRKICIALCVLNNKESLASVVEFVSSYIEAYQKEKRKSAVLTFSDVSSLAVEILKNNTSLRGYFKAKFRYIMIDEFQDNNQQQKDLLYLLAEKQELCSKDLPLAGDLQPDKLFFVGDEKQSIYRFRGADVRVFKELSSELVKFGGKALFLDTNYRSEPA
ncbi:MAG: UvrD-helicase domain-containing protein, partial [Sphaerochaeta sp.]